MDNSLYKVFEPIKESIKSRNISEELFEYLKEQIITGKLPPGCLIPSEIELCEYIGIGRSTLREVMSTLSNLKLIKKTKRGTFVRDDKDFFDILPFSDALKHIHQQDIVEFRFSIECMIAAYAARNANGQDINNLQKSIDHMKKILSYPDILEEFTETDTQFHISLVKATHNELMSRMLTVLRDKLPEHIHEIFYYEPDIKKSAVNHHLKILEAVKNGDEEGARISMHDHLADVANAVKRIKYRSEK